MSFTLNDQKFDFNLTVQVKKKDLPYVSFHSKIFFFQNELRAKSNKFPTVGVDLLWYIINKIG